VYDYPEHFWYLEKEWLKIMREGGTTEDFKKMYKDVDACMDTPAFHYWEEIHKAFPESKIMFTKRDSEDEWYKSFTKQMKENTTWEATILTYFSYTCARMLKYNIVISNLIIGYDFKLTLLKECALNELSLRMWYRRHNAYVLAAAPKDKLLEYSVKEGWGPLCKFLDVPVPDVEFPHKNKGGGIIKEYLATHPLFIQLKREAQFSFAVLVGVVGYMTYNIATNTVKDSVLGLPGKLFSSFVHHLGY